MTVKKYGFVRSAAKWLYKEKQMARLKEYYKNSVLPELIKKFGFTNPCRAPRLTKIVINMGVSQAKEDIKILDDAVSELSQITGQHPLITRAKKSISNFKLRKGMPIGCKVTLRKNRMYEFLDRLVNIALPRIRDFQGVLTSGFDQGNNYNLGIQEQIIFPEINISKVTKVKGMNITIETTAQSQQEAIALLRAFGMPFKEKQGAKRKT